MITDHIPGITLEGIFGVSVTGHGAAGRPARGRLSPVNACAVETRAGCREDGESKTTSSARRGPDAVAVVIRRP